MAVLDSETILTTTEDVLRRYGPAKATVVDVARVLGVSHAAVYRHFPSKAALREAVARRWLGRAHADLAGIAADESLAPPERLRAWLVALFASKRARAMDDPELFATYGVLVSEHSQVAAEHVANLIDQLRSVIAAGDFAVEDPAVAAKAVFDATQAFHHPAHAHDWRLPGVEEAFDHVCDLVVRGLGKPRYTSV